MIRFASIFLALGLAAAGSTALASQSAKPGPMLMSDAQMDDVTAGMLTIVFQDSFNDWTVNFGDSAGSTAGGTARGNGHAKGFEQGKGNPHRTGAVASNGVSPSKHSDTFVFQVNIAANVNAAIAGGDATAGQSVGTQTIATVVPTSTLTTSGSK
jgi:hypothetical protein